MGVHILFQGARGGGFYGGKGNQGIYQGETKWTKKDQIS